MRLLGPAYAALLACAIVTARAVGADQPPAMGMVGLTRDQLARVSLFHDADVAGVICPSIVEIVSADGKLLASSKSNWRQAPAPSSTTT